MTENVTTPDPAPQGAVPLFRIWSTATISSASPRGPEPPILLGGQLEIAEFLSARRLHARRTLDRALSITWVVLGTVALSLAVAIGVSRDRIPPQYKDVAFEVLLFGGAGGFVMLTVLGLVKLYDTVKVRRSYRRKTDAFQPIETTVAGPGMTQTIVTLTEELGWEFFHAYRRTDTLLNLYPRSMDGTPQIKHWVMFLSRQFPTEMDWQRFVAFVETTYPWRGRR